MIDFLKENNNLLFRYTQEMGEDWVSALLQEDEPVRFKQTFNFTKELYIERKQSVEDELDIEDDSATHYFLFATLKGDYYKIKKEY